MFSRAVNLLGGGNEGFKAIIDGKTYQFSATHSRLYYNLIINSDRDSATCDFDKDGVLTAGNVGGGKIRDGAKFLEHLTNPFFSVVAESHIVSRTPKHT